MTRATRFWLISTLAVVGVAATAIVGGVLFLRSASFRDIVRTRIVAEAERATGGRVEIGAFAFNWSTLTADLDNFVIHGTEPSGQEPLLAIDRVSVRLRIISLLDRNVDLSRVTAQHPRTHLIIHADGTTNVPQPHLATATPTIATILDLKIGQFDVVNGLIVAETDIAGSANTKAVPIVWNARGSNLAAHLTWNKAGPQYAGTVSIDPVHFSSDRTEPFDAHIAIDGSLMKNQIAVRHASLRTAESQIDLTALQLSSFLSPVITADYNARVSTREASRILRWKDRPSGIVSAAGRVNYHSFQDFQVDGQLETASLDFANVHGARIQTAFTAKPDSVALNGVRIDWLGGSVQGSGRLSPLNLRGTFTASGSVSHFDAQTLATLASLPQLPYGGLLSGNFQTTGHLNQPLISSHITVEPVPHGVPVHADLDLKYSVPDNALTFAPSWIELPHTRVDLSGVPGARLAVKARSTDAADLLPLLASHSIPLEFKNGTAAFEGTVTGALSNPSIAGHASLQNVALRGQKIDSAAGEFTLSRDSVAATNAAVTMGRLQANVSGSLALVNWSPQEKSAVNANLRLTNADLGQLLGLAGQHNIPITGALNTAAQITGTLGDPHATADFALSRGQIYGEPFDSLTAHAQYRNAGGETLTASLIAGTKRANLTAKLEQAPQRGSPEQVSFTLSTNSLAFSQLNFVHSREPDLAGSAQAKASGTIELTRNAAGHLEPKLASLDGNIDAQHLVYASRNLGDLHLTATTASGVLKTGVLTARLESTLPGTTLRGEGTVGLSGEYPLLGSVSFTNANIPVIVGMFRGPGSAALPFEGSASGEISLTGSVLSPDRIAAAVNIPAFEVHPSADQSEATRKFELHNTGPVKLSLVRSGLQIDAAHFEGPGTDVTLGGSLALTPRAPLNVSVRGAMNLALVRTLLPDLTSAGELNVNAQIRGTWPDPDFSGRAELTKGDFHYADFTNGLTNANGLVLFNGSRATIQNLTAESGGGKVDASGFAAVTGGRFAFRLDVKTNQVRVRYPEGVSSVSDSQITVAGTSQRSDASGNIIIRRIAINPKSDAATILARAEQPVQLASGGTGPLANMNLDIEVETAPDVAFETSVAQSIEADANLRVRGTLNNPALLGRVNVTAGEATFFGNKYTINQGSISFFNPARIDPILNVDLETKARGVDVILTVTGPMNKLNVTYRSDPPLQFGDIIALLATGRTPNDPTLAIRDTGQQQNFQQLGASALLGQAISNPVGGPLQRFFGVSKLKIDPQLTGVTGSPEARLTVEQQVTPDILFTYVSDVSNTSTQLIRVEWALNRRWSAILTREENGYVAVDFAFKKHFK